MIQLVFALVLCFGAGSSPVDPQLKAVLEQLAQMHPKPIESLDADAARKQPTPADAVMAIMKKENKQPEKVGAIDNRKIEGGAGKIAARVYTPAGDGPFPVLLYFHGGGFVIATIDTYDSSCRALCNGANCVVVSVEYRKAPENKYPAAVDDAFAAYKWVRENAAKINADPNRIGIGGESAGGNLATVTCMKAHESNVPLPVFQLLVYPVVNDDMNTPSYQANADAKPLNKAMMGWFFKQYLSDPTSAGDAHVCPMKATDLSYMPSAMVITAAIDPLMSEGDAYAKKLSDAGVAVQHKSYEAMTHEFFGMGAEVDVARQAEMDASAALRSAFKKILLNPDKENAMSLQLKALEQQVMVITGASSGIGLATAQEAAKRGAKLVLAARSENALKKIVEQITSRGGVALAVKCDVSDREQVEKVAAEALAKFGRIDTWVNNAGVSVYGRLDEVTEEDSRRVFDTNFWGIYNGSLVALPHLIKNGGALINVGSEVSEAVAPLQGIYSASKHAVKGFTDALRVEICEIDKAPVSITLIQPTAVDTPYPQHAKNYMNEEPKLPSPMIEAEKVADAILSAAEKPTHHTKVGMNAKINTAAFNLMPKLADRMAARVAKDEQYDEPPRHPAGALYDASETTPVVAQTAGTGGREKD